MRRLVVNPGTPQAWEIQLKLGVNLLGRGTHNDFRIDDLSVSGTHCEIFVSEDSVQIKDLGSTNGTFLNSSKIEQATLQPGQSLQLGNIALAFESDDGEVLEVAPPPLPVLPAVRISSSRLAPAATLPAAPAVAAEPRFCKFHPKSPARFQCHKCNRTFCELCVASRTIGGLVRKTCRSCGVECVPLEGYVVRPSKPKGFFARLPGVAIYPFRGSGLLVLIVATLVIAGLQFMSMGWMSILMKMVALGYLFSYMQNIIHSTAADDGEMPSLPEMDELFGSFFRLAGTVLVAFGIPLGLLVARLCEVDVPTSAIMVTAILGSFYFPMAFLAVAMKDTVLSANPLVVIPAILKVPLQYTGASILFASIFGMSQLGNMVIGAFGSASLTTKEWSVLFLSLGLRAVWSFVSVYLLTINMRILGLLYLTNKEKLGWFRH